jgi:hypothetical protein
MFSKTTFSMRLQRGTQGQLKAPVPNKLAPVCGYADLHLHMFSSYGFGGNWFDANVDSKFTAEQRALGFLPSGIHGHQQISKDWLKTAHTNGLSLVSIPVLNNDFICFGSTKYVCDDMTSAVRQLRKAHEFAAANKDWFEIAYDPWQARDIISKGKLAAVLSVEVTHTYGLSCICASEAR